MKRTFPRIAPVALALAAALPANALAGITLYDQGSKSLKLGGRVQAQYHMNDPDNGDQTDEARIRRAWLTFDGTVSEDWSARIQFQVNSGISTKDAKIQYSGWDAARLTAGNFYVPFSREELTSSKYLQLVEKTLVAGDGVPGRQLGVAIDGGGQGMSWQAGLWEAGLAAGGTNNGISFGSQVDGKNATEGKLVGGRLEFHPSGPVSYAQGNLAGASGWAVAVDAFSWSNDEDAYERATPTTTAAANPNDYDTVTGIGIDGAWRSGPWSVDAEANSFDADTNGGGVTNGFVQNGSGTLTTAQVKGGFMVVPGRWEVAAGVSSEDGDGWNNTETQTGIGLNRFFNGHNNKLQISYVSTSDANGVSGQDSNDLYIQLQHAF